MRNHSESESCWHINAASSCPPSLCSLLPDHEDPLPPPFLLPPPPPSCAGLRTNPTEDPQKIKSCKYSGRGQARPDKQGGQTVPDEALQDQPTGQLHAEGGEGFCHEIQD